MFTAAQWQELEQQALIFKYMMAGIPIPPDLLLPIRKSFDAMPSRFYHHSPLGYCSFYGKKIDPEPGRCRRTDGKKWRCSKDAYPDSKYCERHMHRGRSRSRKPVENQTLPQSQSPSSSSTVTSPTPTGASSADNRAGGGTFRGLHSAAGPQNLNSSSGPDLTKLQVDHGSCSVLGCKDLRYMQGVKADGDEHCFFSGASGNARNFGFDSSLDNTWRLTPSHASFSLSKGGNDFELPSSYSHLQPLPEVGHDSISLLSSQQHCFFGTDFGSSGPLKQESQSLRPFFDDCPKTRDSWAGLDEERANGTSFSTTKLSISIPMASSDFSTTSSRSPNDD